ncbi:MAG: acyl-CoA thioesterase [Ignavibacteria bacterium]
MINSSTTTRVLYAHTDKMGIVNNERFLEFFEIGRVELLRKLGYPYKEMENEMIGLPLIETYLKFISPAYYDDIITINAYLKEKPTARIKIEYELFVEKRLVCTGYTLHSFVNLNTFKPRRPPQRLIELIETYENQSL